MSADHQHPSATSVIERIRPGKTTQQWVADTVALLKSGDPLAPVTLIVPNYYAGRQTRWALAAAGGYVNVRTMLLGDFASTVLGPVGDALDPLTPVLEESAVRVAIRRVGRALAPVAHHRALHGALLQLFRELRRSEVTLDDAQTDMARAAIDAFAVFQELIRPYADRTSIRDCATSQLQGAASVPPALRELGGLVVTLPPRLDPADVRLLAAAARWVPVRAAFATFGLDDLANALPDEAARELGNAVAAGARNPNVIVATSRAEARPAKIRPVEPALSVIRAPDPAEEIREVVRSISRDLDGASPVPLHKTAVLYRQTDPYANLVRDSLTVAGLPWSALEGRTLAESRPGRALLSLLEIRERDFIREAVLGWIDAAPFARAGLPGAAWDRVSRAANIVRGAPQWFSRLDNYSARQRELADQREAEDESPAASALRHEADLAQALRSHIALLREELNPPADNSTWAEFVTWAEHLWTHLCGGVPAWQGEDAPFAEDVQRTLLELRQADVFERNEGTSLALFLVILKDALEGHARPVGSLGQGVLVGPVQSVTGLAFERVYIVGMTEGAFPTPPTADPFFPGANEDPLHLRERQRRAERLAFRTAVAAADGGRLTLSVPDSIQGRRAFPSPWLLEQASEPSGIRPLFTTSFQRLRSEDHPSWLRVVTSVINGIDRAPSLSDLEDRRLRESADREHVARQAMAARIDLPLGVGLALSEGRRSSDFTLFDGNVDAVVPLTDSGRVLAAAQRISASGVEAWATCPFQFFLGRVLRIDATDRPEDGWTVDPLERGSLIHRILERFFKQLRADGRFDTIAAYSSADHQLMEKLATECFADLEQRGVTGHPLVWESTSAAIRTDLRTLLNKDERWRREQGLRPTYFEQRFGMNGADSWPALELDIGGVQVKFRGSIDRIDVDLAGRRAYLYDYKTGSTSAYGNLNDDPVMAGKHIQLALYRRALLASLADVDEADGAYWFVTSRGDFKMLPAELPPHRARRLNEVLEGAIHGILAGAFPQVPGAETARPGVFSWDNCVYCDYERVCPAGRDAAWERKQHAPGYQAQAQLAVHESSEVDE